MASQIGEFCFHSGKLIYIKNENVVIAHRGNVRLARVQSQVMLLHASRVQEMASVLPEVGISIL